MRVLVALLLAACGGGGDEPAIDTGPGTTDDAIIDGVLSGIDTPPSPMALTSSAFAEGAAFPMLHTCDDANTSPPLAWTDPPAGTQSFAIVFRDRTVGILHSVIYDIPATATGLPPDVDKAYEPADVPGAHQTTTLGGVAFGYTGPCPPEGTMHTYQFELFALDVAALPGASMTMTASDARLLILANDLASTTLSGTYAR